MKKLFSARQYLSRKNYRAERMSGLRNEAVRWMQEYETARTARHRDTCMEMIQRTLKKYEYYGHR
jgi:hypothetical protein